MPSSLLQSDGGAFIRMIMVGTYTPMTAENSSCYWQVFAVQEPNRCTGVGHADEVIQ